jgi:hypothetical protein
VKSCPRAVVFRLIELACCRLCAPRCARAVRQSEFDVRTRRFLVRDFAIPSGEEDSSLDRRRMARDSFVCGLFCKRISIFPCHLHRLCPLRSFLFRPVVIVEAEVLVHPVLDTGRPFPPARLPSTFQVSHDQRNVPILQIIAQNMFPLLWQLTFLPFSRFPSCLLALHLGRLTFGNGRRHPRCTSFDLRGRTSPIVRENLLDRTLIGSVA